jgi:RNA polymerase sigma-70 factor (ECF subfamily)
MSSRRADVEAPPAARDPELEVLDQYVAHAHALYRFCRFTLASNDDAEDVVQDTFLRLIEHVRRGGDRSNLAGWLFTVAANGCRDRMRSRRRWLPWEPRLEERPAPAAEEPPDRRAAAAAARTLSARDRLLVGLRAQGLSYREIAAASGIREQSVGRVLARAITRWKTAIDRVRI